MSLRNIYSLEFILNRVKWHKILIDLPSKLSVGIATLKTQQSRLLLSATPVAQ